MQGWNLEYINYISTDKTKAQQEEDRRLREQQNARNAANLHRPNQGGHTPYEYGHGTDIPDK